VKYTYFPELNNVNVLEYFNPAHTISGKDRVAAALTDKFRAHIDNNIGTIFNPETQYIEWYVIKYQSNDGKWHIDGVVLEKSNVSLDYDRNGATTGLDPDGSQYPVDSDAKVAGNPNNLSKMGYEFGGFLKRKCKLAIFNPLLLAVVFVIAVLAVFRVDYDVYYEGAKYLSYLLTPATVCLAIPLYQQLSLLKKNWKAILLAALAGAAASMLSIYLLSLLFGLTHEQYVTLLPKSITTAIGIGACRLLRIRHPIAKGLYIGCAAHAIGTAKAMEMGEVEGAMSSLAIVISGILTVVGASFFAQLL